MASEGSRSVNLMSRYSDNGWVCVLSRNREIDREKTEGEGEKERQRERERVSVCVG